MANDSQARTGRGRARSTGEEHSILGRIEEKLDRLLGNWGDVDWHEHEWAPLDAPLYSYDPGEPAPRFLHGPRSDAPGWDPSLAGPRFDRIDVGSVGTHAVDPVSSFYGAQREPAPPRSSAREYYLIRLAQRGHGNYADYRRRKMRELDRQYAQYCREQQAKFDRDFDAWRAKHSGPPQKVAEPNRETALAE